MHHHLPSTTRTPEPTILERCLPAMAATAQRLMVRRIPEQLPIQYPHALHPHTPWDAMVCQRRRNPPCSMAAIRVGAQLPSHEPLAIARPLAIVSTLRRCRPGVLTQPFRAASLAVAAFDKVRTVRSIPAHLHWHLQPPQRTYITSAHTASTLASV